MPQLSPSDSFVHLFGNGPAHKALRNNARTNVFMGRD